VVPLLRAEGRGLDSFFAPNPEENRFRYKINCCILLCGLPRNRPYLDRQLVSGDTPRTVRW
jgi:hypothetical protein